MYRINQQTNSIQKIEETTFKEIGASERNHLQEWIAKNPEVLCGEDESLLIIQKEFDRFGDTRERLDLLAIDLKGNLVVVENKLDDSGRDVTWQGLKYVSYCASLTTPQIIGMYQSYLGVHDEQLALENLRDFLGLEDGDEVNLNEGDISLYLVAHKFRKEVTSTVLWLISKDINIKCFKAVPYRFGNETLLQIEQIIPLPETQEYVIQIQNKEKVVKALSKNRADMSLMKEFWQSVKDELNSRGFTLYNSVSAGEYFSLSKQVGWGKFALCYGQKGYRVELYFNRDPEKVWFNAMADFKTELDTAFHNELVWQRLDDKKSSRIKLESSYKHFAKSFEQEHKRPLGSWKEGLDWEARRNWFCSNIIEFYEVMLPYWEKAQSKVNGK